MYFFLFFLYLFFFFFFFFFFFSSRRRHTRWTGDWSSDVCSSDLIMFQRADRVWLLSNRPQVNQRASGREDAGRRIRTDRKSTRLNSSHPSISYAVFCLKKKKKNKQKADELTV